MAKEKELKERIKKGNQAKAGGGMLRNSSTSEFSQSSEATFGNNVLRDMRAAQAFNSDAVRAEAQPNFPPPIIFNS